MTMETAAQSATFRDEADAARAAWTNDARARASRAELIAAQRVAQNDDTDNLPWLPLAGAAMRALPGRS